VRFSIVTPSYRSSNWLRLCIASVSDQHVDLEHIVQDAGSDDGTLDWLLTDKRVRPFVEKDRGMYDALNRGFNRSNGDVLAWLNCDEQYLEGALSEVESWFAAHPESEVLFGDIVMTDPQGEYLFHRKVQVPLLHHTWTCHLSTLSCATFFRRSVFERCRFDPEWRDAGDGHWMVRLLRSGTRMGTLDQFTSVFTCTGANMSAGPNAKNENRRLRATAPLWVQSLRPWFVAQHRLRRWMGRMYEQAPFSYSVYTSASPTQRACRKVEVPRFRPEKQQTRTDTNERE